MGNLLNELLYIIKIYKKRAKYIELCKNNRLKIKYPAIDKVNNKLIMNKDKMKGILEDVKIKTIPIFDDTTGQPIYFGIEGETDTFDLEQIHMKTATTEQDSLALSNAMERGRQLERYFSASETKQGKWLLRLVIASVGISLINMAFAYLTLTKLGGG